MAVSNKKKKAAVEKHDCKLFVDTRWRLTTAEDWEPIYDYCQECGQILHEYGEDEK